MTEHNTTTERAQLATVNAAQAVSFSNGILAERNAAAWIEYATAENNLKPQTRKTYERGIRQFATYCAERGISAPDRSTVLQFKRDLTESGKAPATVNLYLVAVRLFFRWASDCGLYREAIADHVKGIREELPIGAHKRDALTPAQATELLQSIDRNTLKGARDYALAVTMTTCALRDIEAVRADKGDIRRKGDAVVLYLQRKGKTRKDEFVILDPLAEKAIREYLTRRAAADGKTLAADAPLFAGVGNKNNGGRLTARAVSGIIKSALREIGLDDPRLTAHSLRHTAITLACKKGVDIRIVQQFAGHKKVTTTEGYAHDLDRLANNCSSIVASMIAG